MKKKVKGKDAMQKSLETVKESSDFIVKNKNIFLVAGGVVLVYLVYRNVKKGFNKVGEAFENPPIDTIPAVVKPNKNNLTISQEEANNLAKSLLDAFNHQVLWYKVTDEEKIEQVFDKLQTGDDFKAVYNAFGKRKRILGGTPTFYVDKKIADYYDLIYWLKEELNSFLDRSLYNKVKERVESANLIF